jgi:acyl dehydratase
MRVYDGLAEFAEAQGDDLGASGWMLIEQARIDQFADATGDHQWIHVDPERAAKGPFGATIAHGLLTLSLLPPLLNSLYRVDNVTMAVNYGFNRIRFMSPVPVDSKVRASATIREVTSLPGAVQAVFETTFEIDGVDKPAAVVESIVRYIG